MNPQLQESGCLAMLYATLDTFAHKIRVTTRDGGTESSSSRERVLSQFLEGCVGVDDAARRLLEIKEDHYLPVSVREDFETYYKEVKNLLNRWQEVIDEGHQRLEEIRRTIPKRIFFGRKKKKRSSSSNRLKWQQVCPELEGLISDIQNGTSTLSRKIESAGQGSVAPICLESTRIFISHSHDDESLVKALQDLLRKAFAFTDKDILCTSVDQGWTDMGEDIHNTLQAKAVGAELMIGVLTPSSCNSRYVSFELGARWGSGKALFPFFAKGATYEDLSGPLESKHCLDMKNEESARTLVEQVAKNFPNVEASEETDYKNLLVDFVNEAV